MSTMLEQAIIDAEALKEAAVKNAEQIVIEKYQGEIKEAVETLLEQDPMEEDPMADPMGDPLGGMGEEEVPETDEALADQIPLASTEGEKLCPCPGEEEEIEIDFDQLAAQMKGEEEGEAADTGAALEMDSPLALEEDVDINEEDLLDLLEELTLDMQPTQSGWLQRPTSHVEYEIDKLQAKTDTELDIEVDEEAPEESAKDLPTKDLSEGMFGDFGRKVKQKIGDWQAQEEEDAAEYRALRDKANDEEDEETRIGGKKRKKFPGSGLGQGLEAALREEDAEELKEAKKQIKKLKNNVRSRIEENVKYKQILLQMKDTLNEVNLQNAKLLYTNQALGDDSLNERQRKTIAEAIAKACSVIEAKTIFEALQSTVGQASVSRRRAPKSLGEAVERRSLTLPQNRGQKDKADHFSDRLKLLAGIN